MSPPNQDRKAGGREGELADRSAARVWLVRHPELPDPDPETEDDGEGMPCQASLTPSPSNLSASQTLLF
jgi:hypothetical protein